MSRSWSSGSTRRWRKLRAAVLARDGGRCRLALPGVCAGAADQVHHTRGKRHGDDPAHLIAACGPCNRAIGDPSTARRTPDPKPQPRTRWDTR